MKPGWLSSEFFVALAALATKVVMLFAVLNMIHGTDPDKLGQAVSEVILGIGGLFATSATAANYTTNRTRLKAEAVRVAAGVPPAPTILAVPPAA